MDNTIIYIISRLPATGFMYNVLNTFFAGGGGDLLRDTYDTYLYSTQGIEGRLDRSTD